MGLGTSGRTALVTDVDAGALADAVGQLPGGGEGVVQVAADLTDLGDVARLATAVTAGLGGAPDILVAAAGTTGAQGMFHEIDDAGWRQTLEVDLMGPVRVVKAFIDGMRPKGWGRIVLLASEDAVQPYADEIPYCAAKAGVLALVKGPSKTYAAEGILVNAVSPAFIHTPMTDLMMEKRAEQEGSSVEAAVESFVDEQRPGIALHRRGEPEEVAAAIAFLVSERASFIDGSNLRVDSGSVQSI